MRCSKSTAGGKQSKQEAKAPHTIVFRYFWSHMVDDPFTCSMMLCSTSSFGYMSATFGCSTIMMSTSLAVPTYTRFNFFFNSPTTDVEYWRGGYIHSPSFCGGSMKTISEVKEATYHWQFLSTLKVTKRFILRGAYTSPTTFKTTHKQRDILEFV